jgi:hypothetical protein
MRCAVAVVKMIVKRGQFAPCPNGIGALWLPTQKGERIRAGVGGVRPQVKPLVWAFASYAGGFKNHGVVIRLFASCHRGDETGADFRALVAVPFLV